jgi:hypothetical protein
MIGMEPPTEAVHAWLEENVAYEPWQWLATTLSVEPRFAGHLLDGIEAAGFSVEE